MKGSVLDSILIPVIVFLVFVGAVFGSILLQSFNETGLISVAVPNLFSILDYGVILLVLGFAAAAIISAFYIQTHPIFMVASIIGLILVLITTPILSNAFMEFASHDTIKTYAETNFPISLQVMGNLPIIVAVFGILIIIALYAKFSDGGGGRT